jgi:hypothetical protein
MRIEAGSRAQACRSVLADPVTCQCVREPVVRTAAKPAVAVVVGAHARAWSTFAVVVALLLYTAVFAFVALVASSVTWAPF